MDTSGLTTLTSCEPCFIIFDTSLAACSEYRIFVIEFLRIPAQDDNYRTNMQQAFRPYHGLRGSSSPVLTATGFVNGRWQFSTPHRLNTP